MFAMTAKISFSTVPFAIGLMMSFAAASGAEAKVTHAPMAKPAKPAPHKASKPPAHEAAKTTAKPHHLPPAKKAAAKTPAPSLKHIVAHAAKPVAKPIVKTVKAKPAMAKPHTKIAVSAVHHKAAPAPVIAKHKPDVKAVHAAKAPAKIPAHVKAETPAPKKPIMHAKPETHAAAKHGDAVKHAPVPATTLHTAHEKAAKPVSHAAKPVVSPAAKPAAAKNLPLPNTRYYRDICKADLTANRKHVGLIMDMASGAVIGDGELMADAKIFPASMTKLMTVYLALTGTLDPTRKITVPSPAFISRATHEQNGSDAIPYNIKSASVADVMDATMIESSNRGPVALAVAMAGSEEKFVQIMNLTASGLGMRNTHFVNATGFPSKGTEDHYTTARDLATLLSTMYQKFPEKMQAFNVGYKKLHGFDVGTHNKLLVHNDASRFNVYAPGTTSGKTGFDCTSGWSIALTAKIQGHDVVYISAGNPTGYGRDSAIRQKLASLSTDFNLRQQPLPTETVHIAQAQAAPFTPPERKPFNPIPLMTLLTGLGYGIYAFGRDRLQKNDSMAPKAFG